MGWKISILLAACVVGMSLSSAGAAGAASPARTPQRVVSEQWVRDIGNRNQRAACELQTVPEVTGRPCDVLPINESVNCPAIFEGAKPPYRNSELRTVTEQVGKFIGEGSTRGFIRINAQAKAKKAWGALGLEQAASGAWLVTYLRYAGETFAPAGTSFQSEAWHQLWVSNWCPTNHPRWEKKG
jgi:hypothetical protein